MSVITGNPNPQEQPGNIHADDAGVTSTIVYEGTFVDGINSLALGLNFPYDISQSFGKSRFEVHYPYDFINSTPETDRLGLWEFFAQKADKGLLVADLPNSAAVNGVPVGNGNNGGVGGISQTDAQLIRTAQQFYQNSFQVGAGWFYNPVDENGNPLKYYAITGTNPDGTPIVTQQNVAPAQNPVGCWTLLLLMLRGFESYPVFAPVLRFTQTVTALYAIQASFLNKGQLISSGTLPTLENMPAGLLFSLPEDAPPQNYIETPGDLAYAWFKDFPTVRQIARLKWNIVQEWQYGLWPIGVFGAPL